MQEFRSASTQIGLKTGSKRTKITWSGKVDEGTMGKKRVICPKCSGAGKIEDRSFVPISPEQIANNKKIFRQCKRCGGDGYITVSTNDKDNSKGSKSDSNCFVATAATNSHNDIDVVALREFRDVVLLNSRIGSAFVSWYYKNGPMLANWIRNRPIARWFVRMSVVRPAGFLIRRVFKPNRMKQS